MLAASPGFAAAAILSLALGIGANTAIFQLLDALRLRSLPVPRPHELVEVIVDGGNRGYGVSQGSFVNLTNPLWEELRRHQKAFSGVFAWGIADHLPVGRVEDARMARGIWVSGELFPVLGVTPFRGRLLRSGRRSPRLRARRSRRQPQVLAARAWRTRRRHRRAASRSASDGFRSSASRRRRFTGLEVGQTLRHRVADLRRSALGQLARSARLLVARRHGTPQVRMDAAIRPPSTSVP